MSKSSLNKLPWFPFYANDFLASSKIAVMTTEEIGAYILLLCHSWNSPGCALPTDTEKLQKLSRYSGNLANILVCFSEIDGEFINTRLYGEWKKSKEIKKIQSKAGIKGMNNRWHKSVITSVITESLTKHNQSQSQSQSQKEEDRKPVRLVQKPTRTAVIDDVWIAEMKANPIYVGIDIDLQLRKCQGWCEAKRASFTRRRVINWLIRAMDDKPMQMPIQIRDGPCQARVRRGLELAPCGKVSVAKIGQRLVCEEHNVRKECHATESSPASQQ